MPNIKLNTAKVIIACGGQGGGGGQ